MVKVVYVHYDLGNINDQHQLLLQLFLPQTHLYDSESHSLTPSMKNKNKTNSPLSMNNSPPARSMESSSPPGSHRGSNTLSPTAESPADSPVDSPVSSDHTSHGFFSPKEELRNSIPPHEPTPSKSPGKTLSPQLSPVFISNRSVRDEPVMMAKVTPNHQDVDTNRVVEDGHAGGSVGGGGGRRPRPTMPALKRARIESTVRMALLGFRVCGLVLCLISFSVMAADKNQGWAQDSFDQYKEFRYCMAVNVMGFVYSGAQASDVAYHLATGNDVPYPFLRNYFDFFMDQVLSYLLISSSSSAATRVEDWKSNWGKDKFPQMATASIALSFLAFAALASSSLLSGYGLCTLRSTT